MAWAQWITRIVQAGDLAKLSPRACQVLLGLIVHCNQAEDAWPSHERLAALLGISISTVGRMLRELEAKGMIVKGTKRRTVYWSLSVLEPMDGPFELAGMHESQLCQLGQSSDSSPVTAMTGQSCDMQPVNSVKAMTESQLGQTGQSCDRVDRSDRSKLCSVRPVKALTDKQGSLTNQGTRRPAGLRKAPGPDPDPEPELEHEPEPARAPAQEEAESIATSLAKISPREHLARILARAGIESGREDRAAALLQLTGWDSTAAERLIETAIDRVRKRNPADPGALLATILERDAGKILAHLREGESSPRQIPYSQQLEARRQRDERDAADRAQAHRDLVSACRALIPALPEAEFGRLWAIVRQMPIPGSDQTLEQVVSDPKSDETAWDWIANRMAYERSKQNGVAGAGTAQGSTQTPQVDRR